MADHFWTGSEAKKQEILDYLDSTKRIFDALVACAAPPVGVQRYGASSHGSAQPVGIAGLNPPMAGTTFTVACVNAPANAAGSLLISGASASIPVLGITLFVDPNRPVPWFNVPVVSSGAGYAEVGIPLGAGSSGLQFFTQLVWTAGGTLSASDALHVTVP